MIKLNPRLDNPNSVEAANFSSRLNQPGFQKKINKKHRDELWDDLQALPDKIKTKLAKASKENPERYKRELREIRHELLLWYNLEEVDDLGCWQRLLDIREELGWYIEETERIFRELSKNKKNVPPKSPADNGFTHRQITIAYFFLGITIDAKNAKAILNAHSRNKSVAKLLQKPITSKNVLCHLTQNKTADRKNLNNLQAAEKLIRSKKNRKALAVLKEVILEFNRRFNEYYSE